MDDLESGIGKFLVINSRVRIPFDEIRLTATTSSGPGGQNVNKVATRVELRFDMGATSALNERDKEKVRARFGQRITRAGEILLSSDRYRSQGRNRDDVLTRLRGEITEALRPVIPRKKTKPTKSSVRRRLDNKKRRSQLKKDRRRLD